MKFQQKITVSIPVVSEVQKIPLPTLTSKIINSPTPTTALIGSIVTDSSGNWKIYTNTNLGFQLTFPAKGVIGYKNTIGECGKYIIESPNSVRMDDFYGISVHEGYDSIQSYLNSVITGIEKIFGPQNIQFLTTSINIPSADEAASIIQTGHYPDEYQRFYVVRKNNKIYDFTVGWQNESGIGCFAPADYKEGVSKGTWDFSKSFKIL
jgi:hypothetical protein